MYPNLRERNVSIMRNNARKVSKRTVSNMTRAGHDSKRNREEFLDEYAVGHNPELLELEIKSKKLRAGLWIEANQTPLWEWVKEMSRL